MFGVAPDRFLVLRLQTLDVDQREVLERIGVTVVEEVEERRDGRRVFRLLVQFPDDQTLSSFVEEYGHYGAENSERVTLPAGMRRDLFDALDSVGIVGSEERTGNRLKREGEPSQGRFYLDVDLWSPGSEAECQELLTSFGELVLSRGGRVVNDPLVIPSLILVKVESTIRLLRDLQELDLVSLVDLPPIPPPEDYFDFLAAVEVPEVLPPVGTDGPKACVVDSGILSGHPLLRGVVVAEEDFHTGEGTSADLNGHGTQVGGVVAYGDVARRLRDNEWRPQVSLYSAKVLRNELNPIDPSNPNPVFPAEERVEAQLKNAIEYFHNEYGCRVFNLSIGHLDRIYSGGRQFPWAALLDDLARKLDIVIVISAGNVHRPDIPSAPNSNLFQRKIIQQLGEDRHRLIDPATAALCLTVGSVARRSDPFTPTASGNLLAASPRGCPSPFTRCGPGVAGAVKPEVVAPGGNFAVASNFGSPRWIAGNLNLGEVTLNRTFATGGQLRSVCGTSIAAASVTHTAARMEAALRDYFGTMPSQNLVRALLVSSALPDANVKNFLGGGQAERLNTVGYGQPSVEYCWSSPNRVSLVAEDSVGYRMFHVYSIVIPEEFLAERGQRSISVSLAFDPPTRLSRRDYIANAMWLEIFGGLTTEQVFEFRSKYAGDGEPPKSPRRNRLDFKPGGQTIRMSTVQKRLWRSNQGTLFINRPNSVGDSTLHIFVGCRPRFPNPLGESSQRYALVITLWHDSQRVDIYQQIRNTVRVRARVGVGT